MFIKCFGQKFESDNDYSNVENILPPTPNAYSLTKHGFSNVGYFTGTLQENIMLHEFKTKNISVPISLSYSTNGFKVDNISSWVGYDWSLNAGGIITRVVNDQPDEHSNHPKLNYDFKPPNNDAYSFMQNVNLESNDEQPDIFSYNVNGVSGKFFLDENLQVLQIPHTSNKITIEFISSELAFSIITPNGVTYLFRDVEKSSSRGFGAKECTNNFSMIASSWYLTNIIHPDGDTIQFSYKPSNYQFYGSKSQKLLKPINTATCGDVFISMDAETNCETLITTNCKILTEISSNRFGKIVFDSKSDRLDSPDYKLDAISVFNYKDELIKKFTFEYLFKDNVYNPNGRMFLSKINQVPIDSKSESPPPYEFEYNSIDQVPDRLSYSQDFWGFYNGKDNNVDLVPKLRFTSSYFYNRGGDRYPNHEKTIIGILQKITYPTGGYQLYNYEPNSYWGEEMTYTDNHLFSESITDMQNITVLSFNCTHDQFVNLVINCYYEDSKNVGNEHLNVTFYKNGVERETFIAKATDEPFEIGYEFFEGEWEFHCSLNSSDEEVIIGGGITFHYSQEEGTVEHEILVGGLRVKSTELIDNIKSESEIRKYYYNVFENKNQSYGIVQQKVPIFEEIINSVYKCSFGSGSTACKEYSGIALYSNSLVDLQHPYSPNHIYYPYITIEYGQNFKGGGQEYYYDYTYDEDGDFQCCGTNRTFSHAPHTNTGWNNGQMYYENQFRVVNGEKRIVHETLYNYEVDERNGGEVYGYAIRKRYESCIDWEYIVECPEEPDPDDFYWVRDYDIDVYDYHKLELMERCNPRYSPWPCWDENKSWYDIVRDGILVYHLWPKKEWGYCHEHPGETVLNVNAIDNFDILKYKIISKWNPLVQRTDRYFDLTGELVQERILDYEYGNSKHCLATKITSTNSKGQVVSNNLLYPQDIVDFDYSICHEQHALALNEINAQYVFCVNDCDEDDPDCNFQCKEDRINAIALAKEDLSSCLEIEINCTSDFCKSLVYLQNYGVQNQLIQSYSTVGNAITNSEISEFSLFNNYPKLHKSKVLKTGNYSSINFNPITYDENAGLVWDSEQFADNVTVDSYDDGKNIVEYHTTQGNHTVMIYAYNNSLPIARIEPATLEDVENALININSSFEDIETLSQNENNILLLEDLMGLLRLEMQNANIISYTYRPGIGIATITDQNNKKMEYNYDSFGRLSTIIDDKGNIINSIEYNYQNQ